MKSTRANQGAQTRRDGMLGKGPRTNDSVVWKREKERERERERIEQCNTKRVVRSQERVGDRGTTRAPRLLEDSEMKTRKTNKRNMTTEESARARRCDGRANETQRHTQGRLWFKTAQMGEGTYATGEMRGGEERRGETRGERRGEGIGRIAQQTE